MRDRLASGLAALGRAPEDAVLDRLVAFLEIVREGNRRAALVGSDDPAELVDRHLLDSAVFLAPIAAAGARRVVDVGSGAGFPGLVLAILDPSLEVVLVESRVKKSTFLDGAIARLDLPPGRARVLVERAETLGRDPEHREAYDAGLARALAPLPIALELVLPLVRPGGLALFAKGPDPAPELAAAVPAVHALGGGPPEVTPYGPVPFHMVRIGKVAPTPARFPRKPGVPQKRPIE